MSAKPEPESSAERIRDEKDWTDGDFEIITADNVRFRVPSFHLYSSSSVFRNAHSVADGSARSVALTDRVCEIAAVFRLYLRLVVEGRLVISRHLPYVKELAIFLDKYGCDQARSLMCSKIENAVRKGDVDAHAAFMAAANARDIPLCRLVLTVQAKDVWPPQQSGETQNPLGGTVGQSVWNSSHWPASTWISGVSQQYLFALARAYGSVQNLTKLADEFERYLGLMTDHTPHHVGGKPFHKAMHTEVARCGGEIRDDATWTRGDFEVITSDDVRFFVPSYHLFSSSSVFRDAHHIDNAVGSKHWLTFTDPLCETSHVFALYLQLVSHGGLHIDRHLKHWKELVVFLDKWDCRQPLQLLCASLGMAIQTKHSPVATLEAFIVACTARDDNLCHLILTARRNSKWKSVKEGAGGKEYELSQHRKESLWDPRFWPANLWTSGVSNTYLYAVARAFGDHGCEESLADGFLHYLAQMSRRHPHA